MRNRMKAAGYLFAAFLGFAPLSQASTIVFYNFNGSNPSPASVAGFVSATALGLSVGSVTFGSAQATTWTNYPGLSGVPYAQGVGGWTANNQAAAKNFRFSITNNGANFTITNISFETRATGAGPSAFGVTINGTPIYSANMTVDVTFAVSLPISGYADIDGATILIQGWTNGTRATAGSGDFRVDTILVQGTVDSPPILRRSSSQPPIKPSHSRPRKSM